LYYDPNQDRSEEFGWKKVCDEQKATEEEQDRWGKWSLVIIAKLTALGFILQY
jgi:hypothetical protein